VSEYYFQIRRLVGAHLIENLGLAEREGFEPPLPFRVNLISRYRQVGDRHIPKQKLAEESSSPLPSHLLIYVSLCE
jgi:hypothetical protein